MEKVHWKWYPDGVVKLTSFNEDEDMILLDSVLFGQLLRVLPFWRVCKACKSAYIKHMETVKG